MVLKVGEPGSEPVIS